MRYFRNSIAHDHDFWYTYVKWWHLQVFFCFFLKFSFFRVFSIGVGVGGVGGDSGECPPTSLKFAHPPPPPGKIPPPSRLPSTKSPPSTTKGSFPPLNNNFLNSQNLSSSDSHHSIKISPQQNSLSHFPRGKGFSPYSLKLFGKLCPPSFQSLNQSFIFNQRTIFM